VILRDPAEQLDPRAKRLWTLEWALLGLGSAIAAAVAVVALAASDRDVAAAVVGVVAGAAVLLVTLLAVVEPRLSYRRFRYEITELGLYVARGWAWRRWQVVPHARVQTVDTKRGPLQRACGLVSVAVTTASARGGTDVPALDPQVADALVEELARRAGIEEGT
jgi:membrane protein YdbS with pleckstrin-like domain